MAEIIILGKALILPSKSPHLFRQEIKALQEKIKDLELALAEKSSYQRLACQLSHHLEMTADVK
ncbi:MAG: hypothetical protein JWM09_236 [Francisellaceae bacterium]|nr:hypothetical protein [Francisellaceae bacterium]